MTKTKICGITNYGDAISASKLGAGYLGFNFYRKSPRYVSKSKARRIISRLPKNIKKVGVFVNESAIKVKNISDFCQLDLIQLSGDENSAYAIKLKKSLSKKIIKSFRVKNEHALAGVKKYKADYIMLDSFKKGIYGGTGTGFDWKLAKSINKNRLFLSGGLNPANVRIAVKNLHPYAVDVCSGIELKPGKKDFGKMKKFIRAVK